MSAALSESFAKEVLKRIRLGCQPRVPIGRGCISRSGTQRFFDQTKINELSVLGGLPHTIPMARGKPSGGGWSKLICTEGGGWRNESLPEK